MADLSITAANVLNGSSSPAPTIGKLAVSVTQGQALYKLADGTYGLADSNGTMPANSFAAFALAAGGAGQWIGITNGVNTSTSGAYVCGATVVSGDTIWLSDTPGAITKTSSDIASGSTVIPIGVVNTDLTMQINPLVGGVK